MMDTCGTTLPHETAGASSLTSTDFAATTSAGSSPVSFGPSCLPRSSPRIRASATRSRKSSSTSTISSRGCLVAKARRTRGTRSSRRCVVSSLSYQYSTLRASVLVLRQAWQVGLGNGGHLSAVGALHRERRSSDARAWLAAGHGTSSKCSSISSSNLFGFHPVSVSSLTRSLASPMLGRGT